jgi:hypothetical protein
LSILRPRNRLNPYAINNQLSRLHPAQRMIVGVGCRNHDLLGRYVQHGLLGAVLVLLNRATTSIFDFTLPSPEPV